ASVNVTATTAGPHVNVSSFLSTAEAGTSIGSVATDTLIAVLPPSIAKQFTPTAILVGGVSTLTFTITNPNPSNALPVVAFTHNSAGARPVAPAPNATLSGCGAPVFAPAAGAASIAFSAGTLAAGGTCTVTVDVTAPSSGTYNNTSGAVSASVAGPGN